MNFDGWYLVWLLVGILFGVLIVATIWRDHNNTFRDHSQDENKKMWSKFYTMWLKTPSEVITVSVDGKNFDIRAEYGKVNRCERIVLIDFIVDNNVVATAIKMDSEDYHSYYTFQVQKPYIKEEITKIIDAAFELISNMPFKKEPTPRSLFEEN